MEEEEEVDKENKGNFSTLTVKCSLKRFLKENEFLVDKVQDAVERMNRITTEAYHLLNLHIRRLIEEGEELPSVTSTWIKRFFYFVSTVGKSEKEDKVFLKDPSIAKTYDDCYLPIVHSAFGLEYVAPSRDNLSECISYAGQEMITCIENNIKSHFVRRQMKYLQAKYPKAEKKELWKELKDLNEKLNWKPDPSLLPFLPSKINKSVVWDLKEEPFKFLAPMYRMNLLLEEKGLKTFSLLPVRRGFVPKCIRINTKDFQKMLSCMRKHEMKDRGFEDEEMCNLYRNGEIKKQRVLWLRKWLLSKGVSIYSNIRKSEVVKSVEQYIRDKFSIQRNDNIIPEKSLSTQKDAPLRDEVVFCAFKNDTLKNHNVPLLREWLLSKGVVISSKSYVKKECIIQHVREFIEANPPDWTTISCIPNTSSNKKRKGRKRKEKSETSVDRDDLVWKQYIDTSRFESYEKEYRFAQSIVTDGISVSVPLRKRDFDQEQQVQKRRKREKSFQDKNKNIPKIQDPENENLFFLKGRKIVGVDPGKHSIVYLTSDSKTKARGKHRMQVSNVQRRRALRTKVFDRIQNMHKKKFPDWKTLESSLSSVSSKATTLKGFQDYLGARFKVQEKLYSYYSNFLFRIHKWERYKSSKRFEHYLVERIKEKFGMDCVLAYGTWNRTSQMKGLIPSQTSGMRNQLSKHFTVVNTPEWNTTKTCSKCLKGTMEKCKTREHPNLKKKREDPDAKLDVRGLRRCNNVKECGVFANRDYNAAINIRSNLFHRIHYGCWHPHFTIPTQEEPNIEEREHMELEINLNQMFTTDTEMGPLPLGRVDTLSP